MRPATPNDEVVPAPAATRGADRRALLADADDGARAEIARLLVALECTVEEVPDGDTALAAAYATRPDLAVLDVAIPGASAYEVCRSLRQRFGERLPIVFVSEHRVEAPDEVAALIIGADEYIAKPIRPDVFMARMRRMLARSDAPPPGASSLTPREHEVLSLLAEGVMPAEIAERLCITEKTTATHLERVLAKLGAHSRAQAVAFAYVYKLVGPGNGRPATSSRASRA
jgi:DNA-binding NarL/FixJ family response regulator